MKSKLFIIEKIFSTTIHFEEESKDLALMSYTVKTKSKGKKNVLMLTTMRPCLGITKDDGKEKPAIYKLYDFTKGGTDIVDQKISYYSTKAKSVKWKMVAFYFILDTSRVNAQTMLALNEKRIHEKQTHLELGLTWSCRLFVQNLNADHDLVYKRILLIRSICM